ncbi:AAA family ATPase [Pseudodesulfovibrio piezophilus]|uniref:Response regulator receiver protein n=1 Tax=Pseudodesulfovibrio piezophilus (strain DSM 21447 / JCM 15486 / C1TLV30) TaxID=1322246 RepID=M1WPZ9_PSEP2|nr:AAA family ATPase [Pseudodesulfovibrio piezophilus]CCH48694.1 Response regulator receiver protein [Pseudodesulfovibrio piezophilus C1TLV30]
MNNRIIPVTLALIDSEERKKLERIIASNYMVRLADEENDEMGVLIYEPGDSVNEDLPHIIHALESGQAEDVYLAGSHADSDILIRGMRNGIREFLHFPIEENDFRAAIMRTAMRSSLDSDTGEKGRIISLMSGKAGLGNTTVAVNLAWELNRRAPGRTLLLDLRRPNGEVQYFLDLKPEYTWGDLMQDVSRLDATYLHSLVTEHPSGLHIMPGPAEGDRPDAQTLYLILEQLRQSYDFVIIDTNFPESGKLTKEVEMADSILLPLHLTLPSLARTSRLIESIRSQDPDAERRMTLIANRVTKDTTIGVAEAADVLSRRIPWVIPEDTSSVQSALNQGTPLVKSYPKSPAAKTIIAMARGLDHRKQPKSRSFSFPFASLFSRKKDMIDAKLAGAVS